MSNISEITEEIASEYANLTNNSSWIQTMSFSDYLLLRNQAIKECEKNIFPKRCSEIPNNCAKVNPVVYPEEQELETLPPIKEHDTKNVKREKPISPISTQKSIPIRFDKPEETISELDVLAALEDD